MPADSAYGVVHISVCNMRDEGKFTSGMSTQALLGMPVKVLQYTGWYEIQTPDDYTGWVHRMVITPMSKEKYDEWNRAEKIVVTSHYGFTYEKPDDDSQTVSDVVAGNRLKWEGSKGHFYKVSYPDGRQAYISRHISQPESKWRASLKQDAESIIKTAYTMIGIPYLWAGTSSKGVDCSGLVRTVLFMHDIIIPRDASQQAYVGERIEIALISPTCNAETSSSSVVKLQPTVKKASHTSASTWVINASSMPWETYISAALIPKTSATMSSTPVVCFLPLASCPI